eukprot:TRINITY_DN646_c0_g1_i1.p1 TRINITY_DN646_c0_g1~~TRINITY_DN646_c0_g1_i1.p1  ORF type:complete len:107 (-),score=8.36 TRINITY_DN646_c0_g1_i1:236-556(-)
MVRLVSWKISAGTDVSFLCVRWSFVSLKGTSCPQMHSFAIVTAISCLSLLCGVVVFSGAPAGIGAGTAAATGGSGGTTTHTAAATAATLLSSRITLLKAAMSPRKP